MAAFFIGFHVDVGIGDAVIEPVETIKARNWLEFVGIRQLLCVHDLEREDSVPHKRFLFSSASARRACAQLDHAEKQ